MARAKYQVLVLPYHIENEKILYCIFRRSDSDIWQFIAGGGEDEDASVMKSAKREAFEEAGIDREEKYYPLETQTSIPTECFPKARIVWGKECLVIPEYAFAVEIADTDMNISHEHTEYKWVDYNTAVEMLRYDGNKTALWELDNKIRLGILG